MRRICSGCCARAGSGHVAAALPISEMKSRRLIAAPEAWTAIVATVTCIPEGVDVRFGSKPDMCAARRHVRFTPNSDRESGHYSVSYAQFIDTLCADPG